MKNKTETTQSKSKKTKQTEKKIDNTIDDSFPASDPPSWTQGQERQ